MADKQNADVPPQTEEPTASAPQATDQKASSADSVMSQVAADKSTASANQPGSAPTVSDGAAAEANATPDDGAAAASANAASGDGAATASNVSTTEHHHPILHDLLIATSQLAKNMRTISHYIVKCHNAFITVQALDACIASSSSTQNSIRLINTMLDIHKSITNEVAADSDADYLEFIKGKIFRYYNLEHIYTACSRYNLRHSRRRVHRSSSRHRRRQRQQQQY